MRADNMNSRSPVLFFARDPGGAAAIVPVIKAFSARRRRYLVFGKDYARGIFARSGIRARTLPSMDQEAVKRWLIRLRPRLVFTGTSADDMTERYLWKAAAAQGIPAVALLDHWVNYGIRFSGYFLHEAARYDRDRRHPYMPTGIFVMDGYARERLQDEGIPRARVHVTGQPHLAMIRERCVAAIRHRSAARRAWGVAPGEHALLFASEPLSGQWGANVRKRLGFDEKTILTALCKAIRSLRADEREHIRLIVRPHPKEDPAALWDTIRRAGCDRTTVSRRFDSAAAVAAADTVCGITSMVLLEAALAGRPLFSVQVGQKRGEDFILEKRGIVNVARTPRALTALLRAAVAGGGRPRKPFRIVDCPVERILKKVDALLCHH